MEILSRLVSKQVTVHKTLLLTVCCSPKARLIKQQIEYAAADLEIPEVVGRILEVCPFNQASVF